MIKVFTVFETMSNGDRVLYNIYPSMLKAVSESEKRLQEDDEIMSMLICYEAITPSGRHTMKHYEISF